MKPDTVVKLGDFAFSRYEIPEKINFGGDQILVVHQLVGGRRVIDAMGRSDAPLEWSGLFQGQTASARARYLDGLRIAGKELELSWGDFRYRVVIASFHAEYERFYQIPYRISLTVAEDKSKPVTQLASAGIDTMITADMSTANALGTSIGNTLLSGKLSALSSAISTVSSFANAAKSTLNSVLTPLADAQAQVKTLIASAGNTVASVTTLGGILPNNPIATSAAKLTNQVSAMTQLPQLYNLQSVLGRMGSNIGTIGTGSNTVTQAGGNLYTLAAKAYGSASSWTTLAKANNTTDPKLSGVNTITVPATADNSGGVLNA